MTTAGGVLRRPLASELRQTVSFLVSTGRQRPALGFYLLALAMMPIKWASPLSGAYERAGWTDVFVALAAAAWLVEKGIGRPWLSRLKPWQLALFAYLALGLASAALVAPGSSTSWATVVLMIELATLALLTADFATSAEARRAIALVVIAGVTLTAVLAAIGIALFYFDVNTSLIGVYGSELVGSSNYTRVAAGFASTALLSSWCIFASAVIAQGDSVGIGSRLRVTAQIVLALICAATVSRGLIGFTVAIAVRALLRHPTPRSKALAASVACAAIALTAGLSIGKLHIDPTRPTTVAYVVAPNTDRREGFTSSLHTLPSHLLVGSGPGALTGHWNGRPLRAHMTLMNVAATLGLPALLVLIAMFVLLWRDRRRPTDVAVWSGLLGVGLDALGEDADHFRHIWVLIGMVGG